MPARIQTIDALNAQIDILESLISSKDQAIALFVRQRDEAQAREQRMLNAIRWALGEAGSDFGDKIPAGARRYWWRTELRERAGLTFDPATCQSFPEKP